MSSSKCMHAEETRMEFDGEKVIASLSSVGKVTKASRTPKRAKGVFIPPIGSSPRRSPRLLAKRRKIMTSSSSMAAVDTPTTSLCCVTTPTRNAILNKVGTA